MRGIFVIFVVVTVASAVWKAVGPSEKVPWQGELAPALAASKKSGRPVLAYFTATWCGPCQSLKQTLWADGEVVRALADRWPTKIDIDAHPDLAKRYAIEAVPTFIKLNASGEVVSRREGAMSKQAFLDWLNK